MYCRILIDCFGYNVHLVDIRSLMNSTLMSMLPFRIVMKEEVR